MQRHIFAFLVEEAVIPFDQQIRALQRLLTQSFTVSPHLTAISPGPVHAVCDAS